MPDIVIACFDPASGTKIASALQQHEYNCIELGSPREISDFFLKQDGDLLILAFSIEEKWAYSCLQALRRSDRHKQIPVLAVLPSASISDLDKVFAAGATDCLTKPFKLKNLLDKARYLLENPHKTEEKEQALPLELGQDMTWLVEYGRKLGDVAEVFAGVAAHDPKARRVACPSPEWTPVIIEEAVSQFHTTSQREFFLLRRNLVTRVPKPQEYNSEVKILIKRSVTPVTASLDFSRLPFTNGLYGMQTARGLMPEFICCVLNSRYCQFFFNRYRPPAEGLRGMYLTRADIEDLPLIIPKEKHQLKFAEMARKIAAIAPDTKQASQMIERGKLITEMNREMFNTLGLREESVHQLADMHF